VTIRDQGCAEMIFIDPVDKRDVCGNAGRASPGGVTGTSRVFSLQAQHCARTGVWH